MTDPKQDDWLDAAFSALPDVTVPADLRRRIAELPITHPRPTRAPWLSPTFASLWWSLCGALGIVCGVYFETPGQTEADTELSAQEELLTAAFASDVGGDWSDNWGEATLGDAEEAR